MFSTLSSRSLFEMLTLKGVVASDSSHLGVINLLAAKGVVKYNHLHIMAFYAVIIVSFVACLYVKKLYNKIFLKTNYFIFPQLEVKSITNIAMIIAMNAALIFTISWLTSGALGILMQIYPGAKAPVESILITIGGIMFGPVIGLFMGAVTNILTIILTSSLMNYGYWLASVMNGFIGGIIHLLIKLKGAKRFRSSSITILILSFALVVLWVYLDANIAAAGAFVNIFSRQIKLSRDFIFYANLFIALVLAGWILAGLASNYLIENPFYKHSRAVHFLHKNHTYLQIIVINYVSYILVELIALPLFDVKISTLPFEQFLTMRLATMIPYLVVSSIVIISIYRLHIHNKLLDIEVDPQAVMAKKTNDLEITYDLKDKICY